MTDTVLIVPTHEGRGFESRPVCFQVTALPKLLTRMCLCHQAVEFSIGLWVEKVTAGLAQSNGSLLPSGWLKVTCRLTACTPGSVPGPTLRHEYGNLLFLPLISSCSVE